MTSVKPSLKLDIRSAIVNAISNDDDLFSKIRGITEDAADFIGVIAVRSVRMIYGEAERLRRYEKKEVINAKLIRTAVRLLLPSETAKYFTESTTDSGKYSDSVGNIYQPFIKRILRKSCCPSKRTAQATSYLAFVMDLLVNDFLVYGSSDESSDDSFKENGILTEYNIVHAIKDIDFLIPFLKKLRLRLPKNLEPDDGIICMTEEKKTSKEDEKESTCKVSMSKIRESSRENIKSP